MKLDFIEFLAEAAGPRIPHPEDAIFDGGNVAKQYIKALKGVIANPTGVSIKWDGDIALIFGYDPEGQFFINDKYMPEGFYAHSAKDWEYYDTQVKKSKSARPSLYPKLAAIWEGLKASVTDRAVFKGDLMAVNPNGQPLQPVKGAYEFTGPTVHYRIPANDSNPMGKIVKGKIAIIVVHQKDGAPWDGKSGLANKSNIAIFNPSAGVKFKLKDPVQASKAVNAAEALIPAAEQFLAGMDKTSQASIKTYFNKKITAQTNDDLYTWIAANGSPAQQRKLLGDNQDGYLYQNADGYEALRNVWNAVYQLKTNLAGQLEQQVAGFEQTVAGQPGGEGFVFNAPTGLVKLVNRGQFGAAHFNK